MLEYSTPKYPLMFASLTDPARPCDGPFLNDAENGLPNYGKALSKLGRLLDHDPGAAFLS